MRRTHLAADRIACLQIELANLRRRNIDVVRAGQVVVVGRAEKAVTVGQNFQHAFGEDVAFFFTLRLKDLKDQVLLAQTAGPGQIQRSGDLGQLGNIFFFEFCNGHLVTCEEIFKGGIREREEIICGQRRREPKQPAVVPRNNVPVRPKLSAAPSLQSDPEPRSSFPGFWYWACETYG